MYGYYHFDFTYFLFMIPAFIISMVAQANVQSTFKKYSGVKNTRNLTGAQAALRVLSNSGITNVRVERVAGNLTDHFDPRANVIRLSESVYDSTSVAAVGVASHEAGHAVQHAVGYVPIRFRQVLVPVTQFSSRLSMPLIFIGLLFPTRWDFLVAAGIALFSFAVLFEIVTLPVEFNASRRAIQVLDSTETLYGEELQGAKKVLSAAAMTYLAATLTSVLSLLRLILVFGNRRGDN